MSARTSMAAALPPRARLALAIARSHDSDCAPATAFCVAARHPGASVDRLQKAIRAQTRRERGQQVFTPPWARPASGRPLTADLDRSASLPEPHHLDDPAALVELLGFIEALGADPAARARLALADEQDELARHQAALAAKALGLTQRRVQQLKRLALDSEAPRGQWTELVRRSASRAATRARRKKATRARLRRREAPGQLGLFRSKK
ncbi:hypothetical protein THIX_60469 [Thiomonas sp. X19]|uniref:hypothetical protein n=1 Tax=Thiomonas sp. X19 TaxID=1050370 RepID=UPI000B683B3B|nr:hypothetical protein [Thiomonas sp. X19]SCC94411.1 hypothetical protein THIX_60469 [Thiomonas sp. X19]